MSKLPVYVEIQKGQCMAHLLDPPGTFVRATSKEGALELLLRAVRDQVTWIRSAGSEVDIEEPFDFEVVETFDGTGPFDPGDPAAIFSPETEPLSQKDVEHWLNLLGRSRVDLLGLVGDLGDDILDWEPDEHSPSIRSLLGHVANADRWYTSRLFALDRLIAEWETGDDLPIMEFLELERSTIVQSLRGLTEEQRSQVFRPSHWTDHPEEEWTARKVVRRTLEHEQEHYRQIKELLTRHAEHRARPLQVQSRPLRDEAAQIWTQLGPWWDEYMGQEGNQFHRLVVEPTAEELLELRRGETVLDIACGNGVFSRRMAQLGANVVAFDVSSPFIERARARTQDGAPIEYHVLDATDEEGLMALGEGRFDAAVANMALMDITVIKPLFAALHRLLRPGGRFVFTMIHPCFGYGLSSKEGRSSHALQWLNKSVAIVKKLVPRSVWTWVYRRIDPIHAARHVRDYLTPTARLGIGIFGQPVPHWYFHRPLQSLLGAAFDAGFVIDRISEPPMPDSPGQAGLLACRLRKLG